MWTYNFATFLHLHFFLSPPPVIFSLLANSYMFLSTVFVRFWKKYFSDLRFMVLNCNVSTFLHIIFLLLSLLLQGYFSLPVCKPYFCASVNCICQILKSHISSLKLQFLDISPPAPFYSPSPSLFSPPGPFFVPLASHSSPSSGFARPFSFPLF